MFVTSKRAISFARGTRSRYFSEITSFLPSNLQLADPSVLTKPEKIVIAPPEAYLYATLNVPETLPVHKFLEPGSFTEPAPIERKIFGAALRKDIVNDCIRYHRHMLRQPQKTKTITEVAGSNKKPRAQKGTGQAQVGHRRNTAWRGGGVAHGPVLRDYSIDLNKKYRAMGMMAVLSAKLREGNLTIFDHLDCENHKTRDLASLLQGHKIHEKVSLLVDVDLHRNLVLSSSNLPLVRVETTKDVNVYQIMQATHLVLSSAALHDLQNRLGRIRSNKGKKQAYDRDMKKYKELVEKGKTILEGENKDKLQQMNSSH